MLPAAPSELLKTSLWKCLKVPTHLTTADLTALPRPGAHLLQDFVGVGLVCLALAIWRFLAAVLLVKMAIALAGFFPTLGVLQVRLSMQDVLVAQAAEGDRNSALQRLFHYTMQV